MNHMVVSNLFRISEEGPVSTQTPNPELVHLRQGDMDGACGPYCIVMALIALGLMTRSQAENMDQFDGRGKKGHFRDALKDFGALVSQGTNTNDLLRLTDFFKTEQLKRNHVFGKKEDVFNAVNDAVEDALPIICLRWEGGSGHWLLVVGYQGIKCDGELRATHLLCLDPGQETPTTGLWNAVVEVFKPDGLSAERGRLSSAHWGMSGGKRKCKLEDTLILKIK
ncbi:hypothetical protein [Pseudomonas sp. 2FG]|uniref:hypothetical protein n=1 Tax=Pseudomonas sp. 2FG TaxID=2502191 RepID=UPI0010F9D008|nr:hypothetical protein [Pseudomonas sp. 2FG]